MVNETYSTNRAMVHLADCHYLASGKGLHPRHGKQHGPFSTLDEACDRAMETGRRNLGICNDCDRRIPGRCVVVKGDRKSGAPMAFGISENFLTDRAVIHLWGCSFLVNRRAPKAEVGARHGPFATLQEAVRKVQATGRSDCRICQFCERRMSKG